MILRRRVALNGAQLDQVDSRILIQGIEPQAGKDQIKTVAMAAGTGSRITSERRDSLDIQVRFTINEKSYRPANRAEVLDKVKKWACGGGVLTVNYKSGQQARVKCAQLPGEGDAASRGEYVIVFRALGVPYWTETTPTSVTISAGTSQASGSLTVNGSAETPLEFTFKNTSGSTVNTLEVSAGGRTMSFSGLGLSNNSTLTVDHDANGYQRIRVGSTSKLICRSGADELMLAPGTETVRVTAGGSGTFTGYSYGRFA